MQRAREAMAEGEILLTKDASLGAVNRFYYAAFYAARSLLATKEMDSSKHSGVISLFQKHFVKTGAIPAEIAKALPRSFEKRQKSDYIDFSEVTSEEARKIKDENQAFIAECSKALEQIIAEQ